MNVTPLFSEQQIAEAVARLAEDIRRDYADRNPLLVGILTGSFMFLADLIRRAAIPCACDFLKISSYEDRMTAGEIKLLLDVTLPVEGRDVIIIEDIVDTGQSLRFARERLERKGAKSVATGVLLYKESERQSYPKEAIDYLGLTLPDVFVVGYGIDYAQRYRELPFIGSAERT